MRKHVAVGILLSPGGMIGPGQHTRPEVIDVALVAAPPDPDTKQPVFRALVRPSDQRMIAKVSAVMDMEDLKPGTVWGDLMAGQGVQLPEAVQQLEAWWAEHVGSDAYSGSARPLLLAHDAFTVRTRLKEHVPLVEELFSHTLDVSSVEAVVGAVTAWDTPPFPSARDAAVDAWKRHTEIWRRIHQPAQVDV